MAEVSPMVSVAETKKINVTAMIAPRLNSGTKGMKCGKATIPTLLISEKSTAPIKMARM